MNITKLNKDEVFVFGSNLGGKHIGGAALQAKEQFGAKEGVGEGLTGMCYAFPTLDTNFEKRGLGQLRESVRDLYKCAKANKKYKFLLTKVGCGIAGYEEDFMKSLFKDAPKNIIKPVGW